MADTDDFKAGDSAEKAYAAAAEAVTLPPVADETAQVADAVEFPAKTKRAPKSPLAADIAPEVEAVPEVAALSAVAPPVAVDPKPGPARPVKAAPVKAAKVIKTTAPKLAVKRAAAKPAPAPAKLRKSAAPKIKTAPKAAAKPVEASPALSFTVPFIAKIKEFPMDVSATIKDAVDGAQAKAKEAFGKTSAVASEYTEFAKGNAEAFVESGKIIAAGLQEIGNQAVAESKTAFETLVADVKALSAVKSPSDFFKLQTELLRRNIDNAVAYGSKTGEAVVKLTGDAIAPISNRVTLAVEKVKKAA